MRLAVVAGASCLHEIVLSVGFFCSSRARVLRRLLPAASPYSDCWARCDTGAKTVNEFGRWLLACHFFIALSLT